MEWSYKDLAVHFDNISGNYDEINHRTYSYYRRFTDTASLIDIKEGDIVLDILARTGKNIVFLSKKRLTKALCIDVSGKMLSIATRRLKDEGLNFLTIRIGGLPLPVKDRSVDKILCIETIEHINNPYEFLMELRRVIKKGKVLVLTTPNPLWEIVHWLAAKLGLHHSEGPHRFLSRKELRRYISLLNFRIDRETTKVIIPAGPDILIRLGEYIERILPDNLMAILGLRRIFICTSQG